MERTEHEDCMHDTLRVDVDELDELEEFIGPNCFGHIEDGFEEVIIELENGRELSFTGYGGGSVDLSVDDDGLNEKSCFDCGEEKSDWVLNKYQPKDGVAVYFCDECDSKDNPMQDVLGALTSPGL